ncbi:unnamed protein product [Closterium sp. NIES-53]
MRGDEDDGLLDSELKLSINPNIQVRIGGPLNPPTTAPHNPQPHSRHSPSIPPPEITEEIGHVPSNLSAFYGDHGAAASQDAEIAVSPLLDLESTNHSSVGGAGGFIFSPAIVGGQITSFLGASVPAALAVFGAAFSGLAFAISSAHQGLPVAAHFGDSDSEDNLRGLTRMPLTGTLLAREFLKRYAKRDILEAAKVGYSIAGQRRGGRVVVLRGRVSLPSTSASMPGGSSLDGDHGFLIMSTSLQSYHSRRATAFYRRREHLRQILAVDFRISDSNGDSILVCGRRAADHGKLAAFVQHGTVVPLASSKRIIGFLDTSWLEQEQQFLETHPNLQPSDLVISRGMVTEGQTVSVMGLLLEARPLEDDGETIRSSSVWSTAQEGLVLEPLGSPVNVGEFFLCWGFFPVSVGWGWGMVLAGVGVDGFVCERGRILPLLGLLPCLLPNLGLWPAGVRQPRAVLTDTGGHGGSREAAQEGLVLEPLRWPVNVGEFCISWGLSSQQGTLLMGMDISSGLFGNEGEMFWAMCFGQ